MQTFSEWEAERIGKFSASEIYKLITKGRKGEYFGEGAQTYINTKVAELLTLERVGGKFNNDAMEWGNAHEEEAAERFLKDYGLPFTYHGVAFPKWYEWTDFSGGSPDGVGDTFIIEIKCPYNSKEHLEHLLLTTAADLKAYAPEYYWQCVWNAIITNRPECIFISYDPRFAIERQQLKVLRFTPDPDDVELIKERVAEAEKQLAVTIELVKEATEV